MRSVLGKESVERRIRCKSGFESVEHDYWMDVGGIPLAPLAGVGLLFRTV
jgi:hypothetical protein